MHLPVLYELSLLALLLRRAAAAAERIRDALTGFYCVQVASAAVLTPGRIYAHAHYRIHLYTQPLALAI